MSDDRTTRRPPDNARIDVNDKWVVAYWCTKWQVTSEQIKQAVNEVGAVVHDVKAKLRK